jgi:putative membrane protein insertion efficiency factor
MIFPFVLLIQIYKYSVSPLLGENKCRYQPSCSTYAIEALKKHGLFKGGYLAAKRIYLVIHGAAVVMIRFLSLFVFFNHS